MSEQVVMRQVVECPYYRGGWIGVWDALVSAVTRRPRAHFFLGNMELSFILKAPEGTQLVAQVSHVSLTEQRK